MEVVPPKRRRKRGFFHGIREKWRRMGTLKPETVDFYSAILFPTTYCIFNISYVSRILEKKIDSDIGDITSPACLQSKRSKKEYRDMSDKQINKYLIINISSASFFCSTFCRKSCMPHFGTDEKKIIDLPVSPCFPILNIGHPLTSIVFLFLHSTFTKLCIRLLLD